MYNSVIQREIFKNYKFYKKFFTSVKLKKSYHSFGREEITCCK